MENKLDKLRKILEVSSRDTISAKEIEKFLVLVLTTIKKEKESFEDVSSERMVKIDEGLSIIEECRKELSKLIENKEQLVSNLFNKELEAVKTLLSEIKKIKSTPGKDGKDGKSIKGEDGRDGKDGKDGSPDTPDEVTNKVNQGKPLIKKERIEGLVDIENNLKHNLYTGISETRARELIDTLSGSGSGTVGPGTANQIAYFNAPTTIASLTTATYPSLTELSYVKGVTSAIQTQLNAKQATLTNGSGTVINGTAVDLGGNLTGNTAIDLNGTSFSFVEGANEFFFIDIANENYKFGDISGALSGGAFLIEAAITTVTNVGGKIRLVDNTLAGASNGYLWTLADQTTGEGGWAVAPTSTITWDAISSPNGDQALTFQVGETSAWTNQNTTESLLTLSTSTLTTGNQLSLVSTSTALASGNEQLNISVSGANATNGITVTGQTISVTNTNVTSGTNIGLEITSSGATTANVGIKARGIGIIGNLSVANAVNSFGVYSSLVVAASDSDIGIINSLRPLNTPGVGTGYLMTLLNASSARADYAYFNGLIETNTAGSHTGALAFFTATGGTLTEKWRITSAGHLNPNTDATYDIGTSTVGINDLHFGSGGIVNFDGGDITLTHSSNTLSMAGGLLSITANATNTYGLLVTGGSTRESNASSGEIKLGGHSTDFGYISYLGSTGDMVFTNMYDAGAGDITFVTRGSGTPVTGLTISGLGVVNPKSLQIGNGTDVTASINFRSSTNTLGYIEYAGTTMTFWTNNVTRMTLSETLLTMAVPIAMGTNSITMTGSIAATGARVTKGWFTDIESTNMPTVGGTAISTSIIASIKDGGSAEIDAAEFGAGASTDGQVLTSDGAGGAAWETPSSGSTLKMRLATSFEATGRFTETNTGAANTVFGTTGIEMPTSATGTSSTSVVWAVANGNFVFQGSPTFSCNVYGGNLGDTTNTRSSFFGMGTVTVTGSGHTYTTAHAGFKVLLAGGVYSLYATQANGTTETASSALTTITSGDELVLIATINGTASVDYYWSKNGGALSSATNLATNVPTGSSSVCQFSVSNNANANFMTLNVAGACYEK